MLSKEIKRHRGEKICVSFIANLVDFTVLKKPTNLKFPIAHKANKIAIPKEPYRK